MKLKLKNKTAAAKRFKISGTGKVRFKRAGLRHCLGNKPTTRKQKLRDKGVLFPGDAALVEACLPYGSTR